MEGKQTPHTESTWKRLLGNLLCFFYAEALWIFYKMNLTTQAFGFYTICIFFFSFVLDCKLFSGREKRYFHVVPAAVEFGEDREVSSSACLT